MDFSIFVRQTSSLLIQTMDEPLTNRTPYSQSAAVPEYAGDPTHEEEMFRLSFHMVIV